MNYAVWLGAAQTDDEAALVVLRHLEPGNYDMGRLPRPIWTDFAERARPGGMRQFLARHPQVVTYKPPHHFRVRGAPPVPGPAFQGGVVVYPHQPPAR